MKKEAMNRKESKEEYMGPVGGLRGRKGRGKSQKKLTKLTKKKETGGDKEASKNKGTCCQA